MSTSSSIKDLSQSIREIYASDPASAESLIERYLKKELKNLPVGERIAALKSLQMEFKGAPVIRDINPDIIENFVKLLLGTNVSKADLSSPELLKKLAETLNTIFDILNQLIQVMNATLGGTQEGEETIRHVIGGNLEGETAPKSLEQHLGQIKEAFLVTQKAFQNTARTMVSKMLIVLDPQQIESEQGSGLKFGALRKAESFELYEKKFAKIKKWFESERFMHDFLREFEKDCQKLYSRR